MTTITISTDELIAAIKRVFPHASTDQTLPALAAMRFTTKGEHLVVSACDRYTIGETRLLPLDSDSGEPVDFLVNAKQLKALLPALKANGLTTVMPRENEDGAEFNGAHVAGYEIEHYPAINNLWPDRFAEMSANNFGFSVGNIKKLSALPQLRGEKNEPIVFGQHPDAGANKPVIVLFGERTRVLIMPVRVGSYSTGDFTSDSRYEDMARPASVAESAAA